jgi:hypothetical protein
MGPARVRTFAAVMLLVSTLVVAPAAGQDIPLWPEGAPEAKGTAAADIPTLKVFPAPKDVSAPVPAVLLIPGGGYKHISSDAGAWAAFKDKPVRFFSMKYRLPAELRLYESGGHDVMNDKNPWKQDMEAWLIQRGILP